MDAEVQVENSSREARLVALKEQRAVVSREIGERKGRGEDVSALIAQSRQLSQKISELEASEQETESRKERTASRQLRCEVLASVEDWDHLAEEWNCLLDRCTEGTPFLTSEWVRSWWETYGGPHELFLVTVRDDDDCLVGLAPLFIVSRDLLHLPKGSLAFCGTGGLGDGAYLDFVIDKTRRPEVLEALVRTLPEHRSSWRAIVLQHVDPETPNLGPLLFLAAAQGLHTLVQPERLAVWGPLPGHYEVFVDNIPVKERRKKARGLFKKLQSAFRELEYRKIEKLEDLPQAFATLEDLSCRSFAAGGQDSSFEDPLWKAFFKRVCRRCALRGSLRFNELCIGGRVVSSRVGFVHGDRYYAYQNAYDPAPELRTYRLGHVLLERRCGASRAYVHAIPHVEGIRPYLCAEDRDASQFPGALALEQRLLTLPNHPGVKPTDLALIGQVVDEARA